MAQRSKTEVDSYLSTLTDTQQVTAIRQLVDAIPRPTPSPPQPKTPKAYWYYPLCLHRLAVERNSLGPLMAYAIRNKAARLRKDTQHAMKMLGVFLDAPEYQQLIADARRSVRDYRTTHKLSVVPSVKVHQDVLLDAFRGDLSLLHFLVYAAIVSRLRVRSMPLNMTISEIRRRVLGFNNATTFATAASTGYKIPFSYHAIRRATLALSGRTVKGRTLLCRATVGRWTWYATPGILQTKGIKSLHQHALNVRMRNAVRAAKELTKDRHASLAYAEALAQLAGKPLPKAPPVELSADSLSVRLYHPEQVADRRSVTAIVKLHGNTYFAVQHLSVDDRAQIELHGGKITDKVPQPA